MPRLAPAIPRGLDPVRRLSYACARRRYGTETEPARTVAHHRPLLVGWGALELFAHRFSRKVDQRLRELATLRAAQLVGCEWCLDFGSKLVHDAGVPEQDLRELATWRESDRFDELDRLVLEYADAMTDTPVAVSEELFGRGLYCVRPAARQPRRAELMSVDSTPRN
jgi:AhpD family alkylhydroperoxidase